MTRKKSNVDNVRSPKAFHPKKAINRKTKLHIVFDPNARKEFLTGFHKRKMQRKKKAQEELQDMLKSERKRLKQEAKESFKKLVAKHQPIPELEETGAIENYELESHSIKIVQLSTTNLAEKNNWIGPNKVEYEEKKEIKKETPLEEEEEITGMELKGPKAIKKVLKKHATKEVKKSKAFQLKNKVEQQKNRKKSKVKLRSQMKHVKNGKKDKRKHK